MSNYDINSNAFLVEQMMKQLLKEGEPAGDDPDSVLMDLKRNC